MNKNDNVEKKDFVFFPFIFVFITLTFYTYHWYHIHQRGNQPDTLCTWCHQLRFGTHPANRLCKCGLAQPPNHYGTVPSNIYYICYDLKNVLRNNSLYKKEVIQWKKLVSIRNFFVYSNNLQIDIINTYKQIHHRLINKHYLDIIVC